MHYPLHITVLCATFWILQSDVYAAKNGLNAEVLTSFAKNLASFLSTTLLGEYQDQSTNQLSSSLLKKIQDTSLFNIESPSSGDPSKSFSNRQLRQTRSPKEAREAFQLGYVTANPSGYSKYQNPEPYKLYDYTVNRDEQIPGNEVNVKPSANFNLDTRGNSIDTDVNAAALYYSDGFQHSNGLKNPSQNLNPYAYFGFQPDYHRSLPQTVEGPGQPAIVGENGNENGRLTRRPYNLNYHAHFHAPNHRHLEFYPYGRPNEGNGQPSPPVNGQDESNPSRLIDDQNQGQSALGGYNYSPHFHYKPPYYGGFCHGFPEFPYHHHHNSHNPGYGDHGGNSTGGYSPYGPPGFSDYKFNPYPYHSPFPPYYNGHGRHGEPQNPPENAGNAEQNAPPENGQNDANGTVHNRPPYGFPPYRPFYGDFYFPGYSLYNGLPYHHFHHHGFHHHPFPYFKVLPYPHFPLGPWHPHFDNYHHQHYNDRRPMMSDKPMQDDKGPNENPEGPPPNSEVEMIAESKAEITQQEKLPSLWLITKEMNKSTSDQSTE